MCNKPNLEPININMDCLEKDLRDIVTATVKDEYHKLYQDTSGDDSCAWTKMTLGVAAALFAGHPDFEVTERDDGKGLRIRKYKKRESHTIGLKDIVDFNMVKSVGQILSLESMPLDLKEGIVTLTTLLFQKRVLKSDGYDPHMMGIIKFIFVLVNSYQDLKGQLESMEKLAN